MPDPYRRTLAELTTRYEFEPDLRDLYVEGATDRHFLVWFFLTSGASRVAVYEVNEAAEVPDSVLSQHRVSGNRGRVIALCKELEMALDSPIQNIRGLIDADYSILLDDIPHSGLLFLTEFSCLECYALTERTLQKFCNLYLSRPLRSRIEVGVA